MAGAHLGVCLTWLALVAVVAAKKSSRKYGNYDLQLAFYSGLREVFTSREYDVMYGKYFTDDKILLESLQDRIDTCDISRFGYTNRDYLVKKGTLWSIFENKEITIGYMPGMGILSKFELDMTVQALKNMIHAYKFNDSKYQRKLKNATDSAQIQYDLYTNYTVGMDYDNIKDDEQDDIKIKIVKIIDDKTEFSGDIKKIKNPRNYDIIVGLYKFDSSNYQSLLKYIVENINEPDDATQLIMFGCNTMRIDLFQICNSKDSNLFVSLREDLQTGGLQKNFDDAFQYLVNNENICLVMPYELVMFTKNHKDELCDANYKEKEKVEKCKKMNFFNITSYNNTSYRVAPLFNFSIPGSKHQDNGIATFSSIIDKAMKNDGKDKTSAAIAADISTKTIYTQTTSFIIPYKLEYMLSSFNLGVSLNILDKVQETENLYSFNNNDKSNNTHTYTTVEKEGKRYLNNALRTLSKFYGRNIQGCSCDYNMMKYTKDPIGPEIEIIYFENKSYTNSSLASIECNKETNAVLRKTLDDVISYLDRTECQIAYSGIVWTNELSKNDKTYVPGTPYASDTLQIISIKNNTNMSKYVEKEEEASEENEDVGFEITYSDIQDFNETIFYLNGTGVYNFAPEGSVAMTIDDLEANINQNNMNYYYFGYKSQIEFIKDKYRTSLGLNKTNEIPMNIYVIPNTSATKEVGNSDNNYKLYSKVNFVNIYNMGSGYELPNGIIDKEARYLSLAALVVSSILIAVVLALFIWRLIRMTCGSIVNAQLRHHAEKFAEKRDNTWCSCCLGSS